MNRYLAPSFGGAYDYDNRYSFMGTPQSPPASYQPQYRPRFGDGAGMLPQGCNGNPLAPPSMYPPPTPCDMGNPCSPTGGAMAAADLMARLQQIGPFAAQRLFPGLDPALVRESTRGAEVPTGFDSGTTLIATTATATLQVAPQKKNMPNRFVMSATQVDFWTVSSLTIGVEPIFATTGASSAAIFAHNSQGPNFRAVVCQVGNTVSLVVTNIDAASHRFTGTLFGVELP